MRLSLQFLKFFKTSKIAFEAGHVHNLQNFHVILQKEFSEKPKQLPSLPFTAKPPKKVPTPAISKPQIQPSPLTMVFEEVESTLNTPQLSSGVDQQIMELNEIIEMSKIPGNETSLPTMNSKVSIMNFSNVPDKSLKVFSHLFLDQTDKASRSMWLSSLANIIPYTSVEQPRSETRVQTNCTACTKKFSMFQKAKYTCYQCKSQFCKNCCLNQVLIPRVQPTKAEPMCSSCLQQFTQRDVEDWMKSCLQFIDAGTVRFTKAAMGCLMVALCLSGSSIKPIIRVARGLFHSGLPEHAMLFITTVLQHSEDTRETLGAYVLSAQIFKSMADENKDDPETQWNHLLAAKESINLALEKESCLDSGSVEIPNYSHVKRDVNQSLHRIKEEQEHIQDQEIKQLWFEMESLWQSRDCEELLALMLDEDSIISTSFLPYPESMTVVALERFLAPKSAFLDCMLIEDKTALLFFRGVLKILKQRPSDGLLDIEEAAYSGHHHEWLREAVVDVVISLLKKDPSLLFPPQSLKEASNGKVLLSNDLFEDRLGLLFPQKHETTPPFDRKWPELTVTGLKLKGHTKFEKAVLSQVHEGEWDSKDAAMAYIDYVPACGHPAEVALCFLNAAMWLLKHLQAIIGSAPLSEVYASKEVIVRCLYHALSLAYLRLHPGMQLYISRLCLGTAMQTMKLTKTFGTKNDVKIIASLMELILHNCRFCPVWNFPSVPLSEAVLINIKTSHLHQDFLIALQNVSGEKLPVNKSELLYQLHENSLQYVCPLEDPEGARARAMEEMLREKGWSWNDVVNLMTSPLTLRDSDGWLIQQPYLGIPMEFAELKGFSFDLDPDHPSIEIITIPADNSRGRVGLFSMQDVQTVLQLDASELYPIFFSLDQPNENQRFHPFQQFRYGTEKLQKTPLLHTLFETDYLLKSFSVGSEVSAKPPFNQRPCKKGLIKNLPPHLQEAVKPVAERGHTLSNINRFWIQAEELIYNQNQVGSKVTVRLGDLKMKICSHPLLPGPDGKLQDTEHDTDPDSPEAKFADDLTSHYNELGLHFPMFARLRELAKLQLIGIILRSILDEMKEKADGKGVEVPREMLTSIQRDAYEQHQTRVSEILRNLDREIGTWPAADNSSEISTVTWKMMDELPYHVRSQASYSDVEPFAIKALQTKDSSVLSQVVDGLMQLCENRVSRYSLEASVRQWLSYRSTSRTTDLKNLICKHIPLPTREEIKSQIISHHRQKYNAFQQKVNSVTATPPRQDKNPCKWVPAALFKEENMDSIRLCYGGVLIAPKIKSGYVSSLPYNAHTMPVRQTGVSYQNRTSTSTFRASFRNSVPADGTDSSGGESGGFGISVGSRLATPTSAKPSKAERGVIVNTFRNTLHPQANNSSNSVRSSTPGEGGKKSGRGRRGGSGGNGGDGGDGDGGDSGKKKRTGIFLAAAATIAIAGTTERKDNSNQTVTDQRKQAQQKAQPFWHDQTRNTILSPKGETINVAPRTTWDSKTKNVVYGIYSEKTGELVYVGKTQQELRTHIGAHVRDIRNAAKTTDLVKFFNSEDHSLSDMRVVVLENVGNAKDLRRKEMETVVKYDTVNSAANMKYPINLKKYRSEYTEI